MISISYPRFFLLVLSSIGLLQLNQFGVAASLQPQIPSVASFTDAGGPGFVFSSSTQIIVDSVFQNSGSPSLISYAQTFREDLISLTGFTSIPEVKAGSLGDSATSPIVFLTLGATDHSYFNGGGLRLCDQ
jgi:hexosaminidase